MPGQTGLSEAEVKQTLLGSGKTLLDVLPATQIRAVNAPCTKNVRRPIGVVRKAVIGPCSHGIISAFQGGGIGLPPRKEIGDPRGTVAEGDRPTLATFDRRIIGQFSRLRRIEHDVRQAWCLRVPDAFERIAVAFTMRVERATGDAVGRVATLDHVGRQSWKTREGCSSPAL